jgi:hypothetical protein
MASTHKVEGIENLPIYLISADQPATISEADFIDSIPLPELVARLKPGQHLYLVDYASNPGHTRLTCLV